MRCRAWPGLAWRPPNSPLPTRHPSPLQPYTPQRAQQRAPMQRDAPRRERQPAGEGGEVAHAQGKGHVAVPIGVEEVGDDGVTLVHLLA